MNTRCLLAGLVVLSFAANLANAQQPNNTRRFGIIGGLAGAGIGAAIGEDKGDAVPGALIGGAIGALGGAVTGSAIDANNAREEAYYQQQQQVQAQRMARAVTIPDVVSMSQSGLGDEVIITHIRNNGTLGPLSASDMIVLKQQGVSDRVINAMQQSPAPSVRVIQTPAPPPVVVEEVYYPRPSVYYYRHGYRPHYHYGPRVHYHW